ncbi:hypothetical protein EON69_01050 [bacterium]|nr:MAG: hypothetical protein EON69_01050 [bacterium]
MLLLAKLDHLVELPCEQELDGCQLLLQLQLGIRLSRTRWALWSPRRAGVLTPLGSGLTGNPLALGASSRNGLQAVRLTRMQLVPRCFALTLVTGLEVVVDSTVTELL